MTGEILTGFLQGYILSGRTLGRVRSGRAQEGPMVFAPYLLPHLLALKGEEDGSALFQGREGRTFFYEADRRGAEEAEDSGAAHRE